MKNKEQNAHVIKEIFSETLCGGLKREAIDCYNGKCKNFNAPIYEAGYIQKKWMEYKELVTKKILPGASIASEKDGFTRIYHFSKETYKIENELFEIIEGLEIKAKIYKSFHQKRSKLNYISIFKYLGQAVTCEEMAIKSGLKNAKAIQGKLKIMKDIILDDFFEDFGTLDKIKPERVARKFYSKYRQYIDELD